MFYKKVVLRNFAKFTGKQLCQSLFSNKFANQRTATLLKRKPHSRCFLVNFAIFSEQPFCKTSAFVCKPKLTQKLYVHNRKQHYKKNFYVLTHMHLPQKHQDPRFHTFQAINHVSVYWSFFCGR